MTKEPFIAHSEISNEIYIICGREKYPVTEQVIKAMQDTGRLKQQPSKDAIEHSKIDKIIEEIKEESFKHHFEQGEYIGEITEQWEVVKLDHVLDILKRNIGE